MRSRKTKQNSFHINTILNMKYIKNYRLTLVLVLLATFISCDDFLEVEDLDDLDITTVFQTEADLTLALNQLYLSLPEADLEDNLFNINPDQAYVVPYFGLMMQFIEILMELAQMVLTFYGEMVQGHLEHFIDIKTLLISTFF